MRKFLIFFIFFSCSRYPSEVEDALNQAGDNRIELEKVLEYYRLSDRQKYQAACFLISNMPYHYTLTSDLLDTFRLKAPRIAKNFAYRTRFSERFENEYGELPGIIEVIEDIKTIGSEYLIENIEFSFMLWRRMPWNKYLSFEHFCEELLPYRLGNEPVESWKKVYHDEFIGVLDSMENRNDPLEACMLLYEHFHTLKWSHVSDLNIPRNMGALTLLSSRVGSCIERTDVFTYIMRSVGIPAGVDAMLQNPDRHGRKHSWNYIRDTTGVIIPFDYEDLEPSRERGSMRKRGKVYREYFGKQYGSIPLKNERTAIPKILDDMFMVDVSHEYYKGTRIGVTVDKSGKNGDNILYLGVYDNKRWVPVSGEKIKRGKTVFSHLEEGILYCPLKYEYGEIIPASFPVIVEANGNKRIMIPDTNNLQSIKIDRKHPFPVNYERFYRTRPVGGKFQGAMRRDFADSVTLHTIEMEANMKYCYVNISEPQKFKYLRYLSAPNTRNSMAEIRFMSSGKELKGRIIGSWIPSKYLPALAYGNVMFDKDPLTYFYATEPSGAWAGLELEKPTQVNQIVYLFRNDDNSVRDSELYELFYFDRHGLVSLGQQMGDTTQCLTWHNVPANALLILRNLTKGREERPFTYEDGKQIWW